VKNDDNNNNNSGNSDQWSQLLDAAVNVDRCGKWTDFDPHKKRADYA